MEINSIEDLIKYHSEKSRGFKYDYMHEKEDIDLKEALGESYKMHSNAVNILKKHTYLNWSELKVYDSFDCYEMYTNELKIVLMKYKNPVQYFVECYEITDDEFIAKINISIRGLEDDDLAKEACLHTLKRYLNQISKSYLRYSNDITI